MQLQELKNWLALLADVRSKLDESKKGPDWATRDWTAEANALEKDLRDNGHDPGGNVGRVFQLARDMFSCVSVNGSPQHKILHDDLNHVERSYDIAEAHGDYDAMDRIIKGPLNGVRYLHNIMKKRIIN